ARRHPLARAMRIDKLSLAALEATLQLYRDPDRAQREIPVLAMLSAPESELAARAERIAVVPQASVIRAAAEVGGGARRRLELDGRRCSVRVEWAGPLRLGAPPCVGRIRDGGLLLAPRPLSDSEADEVARALALL